VHNVSWFVDILHNVFVNLYFVQLWLGSILGWGHDNKVFSCVGLDYWICGLGRVGSRNLDPCPSMV